jgi:hypothetical protein
MLDAGCVERSIQVRRAAAVQQPDSYINRVLCFSRQQHSLRNDHVMRRTLIQVHLQASRMATLSYFCFFLAGYGSEFRFARKRYDLTCLRHGQDKQSTNQKTEKSAVVHSCAILALRPKQTTNKILSRRDRRPEPRSKRRAVQKCVCTAHQHYSKPPAATRSS